MFPRPLLLLILFAGLARAESAWDTAVALVKAKRYPEARPILEKIVAAEPGNAAAWHELGLVWRARHDTPAYEEAVRCFKQAADLEPKNATYLGDYGGASMELASRNRSIAAATNGRDAMEKAVALEPDNLDVREGLFQYYQRAPFFVGGSTSKAAAELEEIRRRDPDRGIVLAVISKADDNDFDGAFALCDEELAKHPDNYTALYQYGRTASLCGRNLERALACLQKALTLESPGPAAPTYSHIWYRIGVIEQKLGRNRDAHMAYAESIKFDPTNRLAEAALAKFN